MFVVLPSADVDGAGPGPPSVFEVTRFNMCLTFCDLERLCLRVKFSVRQCLTCAHPPLSHSTQVWGHSPFHGAVIGRSGHPLPAKKRRLDKCGGWRGTCRGELCTQYGGHRRKDDAGIPSRGVLDFCLNYTSRPGRTRSVAAGLDSVYVRGCQLRVLGPMRASSPPALATCWIWRTYAVARLSQHSLALVPQ